MAELSDFLPSGGSPLKLAPDLGFLASRNAGAQQGFTQVVISNANNGLNTRLSLNGKFVLSKLQMTGIANSSTCRMRLTIDGVVIMEDLTDYTVNGSDSFIGASSSTSAIGEQFIVESSLTLEYECSDANISLQYLIRPIV